MQVKFPPHIKVTDLADFVADQDCKIIEDQNNYKVVPIKGNPKTIDYTVQEAAKLIGIGSKKLFILLKEKNILDINNLPKRNYTEAGYLKTKLSSWTHPTTGQYQIRSRPIVTSKGVKWLKKMVDNQQTNPLKKAQ